MPSSTALSPCEDAIIEPQLLVPLEDEAAPGCYGKIPGTGDFIVRRLPHGFVSQWDRWLQEALEGARAILGEHWDETYFTAPIWRFALAPGLCDDTGWAGVVMPSVDKVGRTFPLTLAVRLPAVRHLAAALFECAQWFAELEETALAALRIDADPRSLDEALLDVPFPACEHGLPPYAPASTATQWLAQSHEVPLQLAHVDDFAKVAAVAATEAFTAAPAWHAYWWTRGRNDRHASALVLSGLPDARTFASMLSI